ncbi:hypothetical protein ACI6QG_08515 [Roseococcus sp. DSY-14]|uniref:hypothetical protein n=1 Tax=Roseococcus sp. DSY-14 TaxID=3369650 RepID=UPI00387B4CB9
MSTRGFLEDAAPRLGLRQEERDWVMDAGLEDYDALYSLLAISPSVRKRRGVRREDLLRTLEGLVSPELLDLPTAPAQALDEAPPPPAGGAAPADWPGRAPLRDPPAFDHLGALARAGWPVRDQGNEPDCVPFAVAAMLEFRLGPPPPRLSPLSLVAALRALGRPLGAGGTKLLAARAALHQPGILRHAEWPDTMPRAADPPPALWQGALRADAPAWDPGGNAPRFPFVAAALHAAARAAPCAITCAVWRDPEAPPGQDTWRSPQGWAFGKVLPRDPDFVPAGGHAACVLGFRPDANEAAGGHFLLRNSWSTAWGMRARPSNDPAMPPAPGYGTLAARIVEDELYEIMQAP